MNTKKKKIVKAKLGKYGYIGYDPEVPYVEDIELKSEGIIINYDYSKRFPKEGWLSVEWCPNEYEVDIREIMLCISEQKETL